LFSGVRRFCLGGFLLRFLFLRNFSFLSLLKKWIQLQLLLDPLLERQDGQLKQFQILNLLGSELLE
jgi:hypothetical protein